MRRTEATLNYRLEDTRSCFNALVRRASRVLNRYYDTELRPSGLKITQFNVLAALAQAPAMPLTRLADLLAIERSALARNLKPLERQGYVEVSIGADKRSRFARLTRAGAAKLKI